VGTVSTQATEDTGYADKVIIAVDDASVIPLGTVINYTVGAFSPPTFFGPPGFFAPPGFFVPTPPCTSCTGSLNYIETLSYCLDGCRYTYDRYHWNTPLCQPDPCTPCTCNAYDDTAATLLCCSCFGCYPAAAPSFFSPPGFFGPPGFAEPPFSPPAFFAPPGFK
jgi:hypothetical protein